jgi:hypothetical protein
VHLRRRQGEGHRSQRRVALLALHQRELIHPLSFASASEFHIRRSVVLVVDVSSC